jgi:hypothetical protein
MQCNHMFSSTWKLYAKDNNDAISAVEPAALKSSNALRKATLYNVDVIEICETTCDGLFGTRWYKYEKLDIFPMIVTHRPIVFSWQHSGNRSALCRYLQCRYAPPARYFNPSPRCEGNSCVLHAPPKIHPISKDQRRNTQEMLTWTSRARLSWFWIGVI